MNNQIAPKRAVNSDLAPNSPKRQAGPRSQHERSNRSDRTDSFGIALRKAVQKSRDGRADRDRAAAGVRDARRSATNDRLGSGDRRTKQSEQIKSFDRSDERALVEDTSTRDSEQLAEAERWEESGPASGDDTSTTSAERQLRQSAGSAIGETAELLPDPDLDMDAADGDVAETLEAQANDLPDAVDETLFVDETTGSQRATSDPAEDGAIISQEPAAKLATTINLEEVANSSLTPKPDPLDREMEQGRPLQPSNSNTGNLIGGAQQSEGVSLGGPGPQQADQAANTGLAPRVSSAIAASDADSQASVDGTAEGSTDELEVPGISVDVQNSSESESSDGRVASDSAMSDMSRSAKGQAETAGRTSSAASQDGLGKLSAQPLPSSSVTSSVDGAVKPTPVVDAVPKVGAADAQVLSAEALSTDGRSGDAVWRQVQRAIGAIRHLGEGDHEFKIRLTPRELGSVTIDIRSSEGGIAIGLVTETTAASDRLNQQRDQLLQELAESGLDSSSVDISQEGSSFGLHDGGGWNARGQDVPESETTGLSDQGQEREESSAQLTRRALGVNHPGGSSRLDIAL